MKSKEREKEILEDRPKRELVDDALWILKTTNQIPSKYTIPYEEICSDLADCRLDLYRDEGRRIDSKSYECLYMVQTVILLHQLSYSSSVQKGIDFDTG